MLSDCGLGMLFARKRRYADFDDMRLLRLFEGRNLRSSAVFVHDGGENILFQLFILYYFSNTGARHTAVENSRLAGFDFKTVEGVEVDMRVASQTFELVAFARAVEVECALEFSKVQRNAIGVLTVIESDSEDEALIENVFEKSRLLDLSVCAAHDILLKSVRWLLNCGILPKVLTASSRLERNGRIFPVALSAHRSDVHLYDCRNGKHLVRYGQSTFTFILLSKRGKNHSFFFRIGQQLGYAGSRDAVITHGSGLSVHTEIFVKREMHMRIFLDTG